MKRIKLNLSKFKKTFIKTVSVLFSLMSVLLLLVSKEELGINTYREAIVVFGMVGAVALIFTVVRIFTYKKIEVFNNTKCSLTLRYGDLWKIAFRKNRFGNDSKKIVVVGVNTAFDTIVDNDLSQIAKPLVSGRTIHGQWLNKMKSKGIDEVTINQAIQSNLEIQGVNKVSTLDVSNKERGNLECFEKGTIAVYEYENTIFYLLAIAEFDENNNAQNSKDELIESIKALVMFYDRCGQAYDIYIPLLGTGMSRTDITPEESLKIMASMFEVYKSRLNGNINIIVYENQRNDISIDV